MEKKVNSSSKLCATCTYWCDQRQPGDRNLMTVEYDDSEKGRCTVQPSILRDTFGKLLGCNKP